MVVRIPLRDKRDGITKYALVDDEDTRNLAWLLGRKWNVSADGYARTSVQRKLSPEEHERRGTTRPRIVETVWMHRYIMGLGTSDPREVDHQNGDRLDNTRRNLYVVSQAENLKNIRRKAKVLLKTWRQQHAGKTLRLDGALADEEAVKPAVRSVRKRV